MPPAIRPPPVTAPKSSDNVLILENFPPYRLNVLAAIVSQGFERLYSERFGIGIPQWRVLAVLGQYGGLTSKDIGMRSHMHKTMVSRAVGELERNGLVERRLNRADRREAFLSLTTTGQRTYGEIVPLARDYAARLTADLSEADREAFDRIVEMLRERSGIVFAATPTPPG